MIPRESKHQQFNQIFNNQHLQQPDNQYINPNAAQNQFNINNNSNLNLNANPFVRETPFRPVNFNGNGYKYHNEDDDWLDLQQSIKIETNSLTNDLNFNFNGFNCNNSNINNSFYGERSMSNADGINLNKNIWNNEERSLSTKSDSFLFSPFQSSEKLNTDLSSLKLNEKGIVKETKPKKLIVSTANFNDLNLNNYSSSSYQNNNDNNNKERQEIKVSFPKTGHTTQKPQKAKPSNSNFNKTIISTVPHPEGFSSTFYKRGVNNFMFVRELQPKLSTAKNKDLIEIRVSLPSIDLNECIFKMRCYIVNIHLNQFNKKFSGLKISQKNKKRGFGRR